MNRNNNVFETDASTAMEMICRAPWEHYVPPFEVVSGVYYVSGVDWVSCYLLASDQGLILLDTSLHESVYLVVDAIYRLGYKLDDLKYILISHMHGDHAAGARALQELTGARIFMSRRDLPLLNNRKLMLSEPQWTCGDILSTDFYEDSPIINLGNITITTIPSPGHTPGTTSFIFWIKDKKYGPLTVALHGGLGTNTMSKDYLESAGFPRSLQKEYLRSLELLDQLDVDVCIPSHAGHYNILELREQKTETYNPFINRKEWHDLLGRFMLEIKKIMEI